MDVNNLKKDVIYVLNKNEGVIAAFNKDDDDTLINPVIDEVQNSDTTLTFQVPANSEKWKSTYNPENLYLVDTKVFSANFTDSIERERNEDGEDLITIVAYERQKLLEREFVRAWNSTTGFESIDDFMVVIVSGGNLPLVNNGYNVTTTHQKGTSGYVLDGLLFGTGWTTGICDVEGTFDLETDQLSIYENIMQVQETWGGILVFDSLNKQVHHRDETTWLPYSGFEVKYQKNLQSSKYIGDNKIITYLCPLGEGGLNIKDVNNNSLWLVNTTYTNTVLKGIENNDNIYEQEQLKRWGERKLEELCKPRRELTMTTALLNSVEGYELETVHLNDIVDVIDFEFVEDRVTQLRVIEYKHYVWTGADAELVIGDITLDSTDIFKKTARATNLINNGTLDTTKVVDYYKSGQSLKKTLRQIDQTIVDTKTELELADDGISARVTQTNTRVDNLNNDIISQDQRITQLTIDVDGIDSKVSTIADLTETLTSNNGQVTIPDAVEGYLLGISIHGYDGSFGATYLSENTVLSEDTVLLGNTVQFALHTKNNVPTKEPYYELGNISAATGEKTDSSNYLRNKELISVVPESVMYFSLDNTNFAFGDVYFYGRNGNYINSWNTLYDEDSINNLSGKQIEIPQNCYYISYTIQNKIILRSRALMSYPIPSHNTEPGTDDATDDYSYVSYDNVPEKENPELDLLPSSIPGIKPQLEYGTEKTDFIDYNSKTYEFEVEDELREMWIDEEDVAPSTVDSYTLGLYNSSTGAFTEDSTSAGRFANTTLIEVLTGEHIHITVDDDYQLDHICFFDEDEEFLGTEYSLYAIDITQYENDIELNMLSQIKYIAVNVSIKDSSTPTLATMVTDADLAILVTDSMIFDEFTIIDKNAVLIRRIGVDQYGNKYELTNPEYHSYGEVEIYMAQGTNYLEVIYDTPVVIVEYGKISKYTDLFATKVEMATRIHQTDEYIELTASKLVSKDGIIVDLNSRLHMDAEKILIESNKIRISSSYGTWDYDGYFTTTYAKIANWNLKNGLLFANSTVDGVTYQSGLDSRNNNYMLYAGLDISDGQTHNLSESNAYITKSGRVYAKWFEVNGESGSFYVRYDNGQIAMSFDKNSTWRYLSNGNNWTCEGIGFSGGVANMHCLWLYDAKAYSIESGIHNTVLARFARVGNNAEPARIDFYADSYINGNPIQTGSSDERLKDNIEESDTDALSIIKDIDFYKFDWKDESKGHVDIGFVAQRLQKQYDKLVIHSEGSDNKGNPIDTYQIDLLNTIALAMKGIQELEKKNEDLEKRLEEIEKKLGNK